MNVHAAYRRCQAVVDYTLSTCLTREKGLQDQWCSRHKHICLLPGIQMLSSAIRAFRSRGSRGKDLDSVAVRISASSTYFASTS